MDCTVLASVISSYAPYMVRAHVTITINLILFLSCFLFLFSKAEKYFDKMYSLPSTPEQVNHNALLLVEACREMNINYDIQVSACTGVHVLYILKYMYMYVMWVWLPLVCNNVRIIFVCLYAYKIIIILSFFLFLRSLLICLPLTQLVCCSSLPISSTLSPLTLLIQL